VESRLFLYLELVFFIREVGFMGKNTSFSLGDRFAEFIDRQVADGRYGNASDVVRAALRMLEDHETKLENLRKALIDGEESGVSTAFDFDAFIAERREQERSML
jgi:antitoxin ParD1/3/4